MSPNQNISTVHLVSEALLLVLMGPYAANAIATYISQIFGASFLVYSYISVILSASVLFLLIIFSGLLKHIRSLVSNNCDRHNAVLLFVLCLAGGFLALFSFRPDADDYYYLPNARFFLENPTFELSLAIHYLYSGEIEFQSFSWATSTPYELFAAAIDYVVSVDFLAFYYYISPFVVGFLIPLALFYLARQLVGHDREAIVGTAFAILLVTMLFDTHRTFGNLSFVRAFQGKTFVLAVCVPALAGAILAFLSNAKWVRWVLVLSITIAGLGASASSVVLLPPLAFLVAMSYWVESKDEFHVFMNKSLALGSAFSVLLLYAVIYKLHFSSAMGLDSPANAGWPTKFWGQCKFFLNDSLPVTALVIGLSSILVTLCRNASGRVMLLSWMCLAALLLLNPVTGDFLIQNVTGPNIYWRLFYLWPFPVGAVVLWACVDSYLIRWMRDRHAFSWVSVCVAIALCAGILWVRGTIAPALKYKIPEKDARIAKLVVGMAPHGLMLAPQSLAGPIGIFSSKYPQIAVRTDAVSTWLWEQGRLGEAEQRIKAARFAQLGNADDFGAFRWVVQNYPLKSIVMNTQSYESVPDRQFFFSRHELCPKDISAGYVMLYRGSDCR